MSRYDLSPVFGSAAGAFISLSGWCSLYLVLCYLNPARRPEWHCRITTVVHAVLVCFLSACAALIQGPWPFTDPGGPNTTLQRVVVMICLGYFLFDFAWCLTFETEGLPMLAHHVLSILGLSVTLFIGRYGTEMMACVFGTEITNPLLQFRWFLREIGLHKTPLGRANDMAFVGLFGFMRVGLGSYLLYTYFCHPRPDWLGKFGGVTLYLIGWMFWVQICIYAWRKLLRPNVTSRDQANATSRDQESVKSRGLADSSDQSRDESREPLLGEQNGAILEANGTSGTSMKRGVVGGKKGQTEGQQQAEGQTLDHVNNVVKGVHAERLKSE